MCSIAIFVVATTGDGEPPENMKMAWRALLRKNLGGTWMNGVNYAVFGLGDSSYSKYNVVARRLQVNTINDILCKYNKVSSCSRVCSNWEQSVLLKEVWGMINTHLDTLAL
jgi:flavodoxin